jgi:hypothetical protein
MGSLRLGAGQARPPATTSAFAMAQPLHGFTPAFAGYAERVRDSFGRQGAGPTKRR